MKWFVTLFVLALVLSAGTAWAFDSDQAGIADGLIPDASGWSPPGGTPALIGGASDTFVQTWGGGSWSGIYDDDAYAWVNILGDPDAETVNVLCDIEMYVSESLDANVAYFHLKGDTYDPMSAVFTGLLKSNNGQYLGIEIPANKDITELVGTTDGLGRDVTLAQGYAPIDVLWEMRWSLNDGGWSAFTTGTDGYGNNGQVHAIWWLIDGGKPSNHNFEIRCTISPKYHQPDGQYVLDPNLVVAPEI